MIHPGETPQAEPDLAYFEVGIPRGSEQTLALHGLAKAYGWQVNEVAPGTHGTADGIDNPVVDTMLLQDVSINLYGESVYGNTARSFLDLTGFHYNFTVVEQNGLTLLNSPYFDPARARYPILGAAGMSQDDIRRRVDEVVAPKEPPFDVELQPCDDNSGSSYEKRLFTAQPGSITVPKLLRHIRARGLDGHTLHGTLGKAMDVLNAVADTAAPREDGSYDEQPFVVVKDIAKLARSNGVTNTGIKTIREKLGSGLIAQSRTGQPSSKLGVEIVLNGPFDAREWYQADMSDLRVAVASLAGLAGSYSQPRQGQAFLAQLPKLLEVR